jgi:hypothetical protein
LLLLSENEFIGRYQKRSSNWRIYGSGETAIECNLVEEFESY